MVILCGLAITCTKESMAIRDGVGKGAVQPAHFLIFKPGAERGKVELFHEHLFTFCLWFRCSSEKGGDWDPWH